MKNDLGLRPYKTVIELLLSDDQKVKQKKFTNWLRTNFRKEGRHENFFDIDDVYDDRIWIVNRTDTNRKGGIQQRQKFPQQVMIWLGACSKNVTSLMILDEGTINHIISIEKVLLVTLNYGKQVFGSKWIFQQDGVRPLTRII